MKRLILFLIVAALCTVATSCGNKPAQSTSAPTELPTDPAEACEVTFLDHDKTVLTVQTVEKGKSATAPVPPDRDGYVFIGWDGDYSCVEQNLTVTAQYTDIQSPAVLVLNMKAKAGQIISVPVQIVNNPGIAGAKITIIFDEELTLKDSTPGTAFAYLDHTPPGKYVSPSSYTWDSETGEATENGTILYLNFVIPENAVKGKQYSVNCTYHKGDIYDENLEDVTLTVISGSIAVE